MTVLKYHFLGKIARFPREMADFRTGEGSAQDEAGTSCQTECKGAVKLNGLTLVKGWEI